MMPRYVPTRHAKQKKARDLLMTGRSDCGTFAKKTRIDPPRKVNRVGTTNVAIGESERPVKFPTKNPSARNAHSIVPSLYNRANQPHILPVKGKKRGLLRDLN